MNGAECLLQTLTNSNIEVCFTNPGTSEMRFVAALDRVAGMRPILVLFEGVAAGAADGYARMAEKPASTLLHLGPGMGNALAYFHDARRARVPLVNIVGEHATWHLKYDAPLTSDIEGIARPVSGWVETVQSAADMPRLARECISASWGPPGQVSTLIVPADVSWDPAPDAGEAATRPDKPVVSDERIAAVAKILRSDKGSAFLMNGEALIGETLELAAAISKATGALLVSDTLFTRVESGVGRPLIHRLPYFPEPAAALLANTSNLFMVGTKAPIAFFGYPGLSSRLAPEHCEETTLVGPDEDIADAIQRLADALGVKAGDCERLERLMPESGTGPLDVDSIIRTVTRLLPENAIVVDESVGAGFGRVGQIANSAPHDMLSHCGGAIGQGMPVSLGAAIACPDRRVVNLQSDGSAMYTPQSLWSQARESANVTTVLLNNQRYAVLEVEYDRLEGGEAGPRARSTMELDKPALDFVQLAGSMGVPAKRAETVEDFVRLFEAFKNEPGPNLIEAMI